MSLLGYSLMTVLHEVVFSFENICNLYNIVEQLRYIIYQLTKTIRHVLVFIVVYNKISITEKSNLLAIYVKKSNRSKIN